MVSLHATDVSFCRKNIRKYKKRRVKTFVLTFLSLVKARVAKNIALVYPGKSK